MAIPPLASSLLFSFGLSALAFLAAAALAGLCDLLESIAQQRQDARLTHLYKGVPR